MVKLMEFYTTKDKQKAIAKLKKLFNEVIISDIYKTDDGIYTIERLTKEMFYINSVEAQSEMDGYLDYMIKNIDKTLDEKTEVINNTDSFEESTMDSDKQEQIEDFKNIVK